MKTNRFGIAAVMLLCCAVFSFSDGLLSEVQEEVHNFSETMAKSLPFNASIGLNWSDAYIGQLIGLPPHFGIGISGGVTSMDSDSLQKVLEAFDMSLPIARMVMPAYTLEGRIGGFLLPFDVGIKFGALPEHNLGDTFTIDYTLVGADFRYALLTGGVILPAVSVGVGINYLRGGLTAPLPSMGFKVIHDKWLEYTDSTGGFTWETTALDFKAQVSKSFFFITPYLGLGLSHAWSKAGYSVKGNLTYTGGTVDQLKNDLAAAEITGIDLEDNKGFSSIIENTGWSLRAFGGLAFNLAFIKIDITGMFNFLDANWGGTLGIRFQL
jgi:hypothetical protein